MIHAIKNLCQITKYSSNTHFFWLIDLNTLSDSLMAGSSVDISFPKTVPFSDQDVVCMQELAESTVHIFLGCLRKNR